MMAGSGSSSWESFCFIAGRKTCIDPVRLKVIYPDHKTCEREVTSNVAKLVKERWITSQDGDELITESKEANIA
jgi:Alpha/beta hydrolase domain